MHSDLQRYYSYSVFLTVDKQEQLSRLEKRNPNMLNNFIQRWIPLEELYFKTFSIQDICDIKIDTSKAWIIRPYRLLTKWLSTVFLKSDRISVAETYFINPKIVDVSAIYYAKNDIIIEGLWRISQWLWLTETMQN